MHVCRLDLGLYAHPKEFLGNGVRTHVNSKGKIPSTRGSEEGRTRAAASRRTSNPTHYRLSYFGLMKRNYVKISKGVTGNITGSGRGVHGK